MDKSFESTIHLGEFARKNSTLLHGTTLSIDMKRWLVFQAIDAHSKRYEVQYVVWLSW